MYVNFKQKAATEAGVPLRTVYVPSYLHENFLKIAESNTRKNLETCGILCAKLV
jgi:STAM-binding protein